MRQTDASKPTFATLGFVQAILRKYPALRPFRSLQNRDYFIYWMALGAQQWTNNMQMFVRPWYAYLLTDRAILIGVVALAQGIPVIFVSLYGGALADRMNKRNVVIAGFAITTVSSLGLAIVIGTGIIEWWHLIISAAVAGVGQALANGARQAIISDLVERDDLLNAVSLANLPNNVARIASPAIAGLLLGISLGIAGVYYLMTALGVLSVFVMLYLPALPSIAQIRGESIMRNMAEGLAYVKRHKIIIWLILTFMVSASFGMPYLHLLPVLAKEEWTEETWKIGLLFTMPGVGALVGSLAMASMVDFRRKGLLLLLITSGFGVGIVALAFSPHYLIAAIVLLPVGLFQSARISLNSTLTQLQAADEVRGRVMGIYQIETGVNPFGILAITALADVLPSHGAQYALAVSGTMLVLFCLYTLYTRPYLRNLS